MLIATTQSLLAKDSRLLPITRNIVLQETTGRFFKFTDFEPSACFIGETLSQPRLLTLTPYDPVFLAIEKVWPLHEGALNQLDDLLEEKDMHLMPLLKDSFVRICDVSELRGSTYYKVSPPKIVAILQAKYNRLLQVCSQRGISLRKPGLETKDPINAASPVVVSILKQDIDQFFIKKLQEQLNIEATQPSVQPLPFVFHDPPVEHEESPKKNMRKSQHAHKPETKKDKEMKAIKAENRSIDSFLVKKDLTPNKN